MVQRAIWRTDTAATISEYVMVDGVSGDKGYYHGPGERARASKAPKQNGD